LTVCDISGGEAETKYFNEKEAYRMNEKQDYYGYLDKYIESLSLKNYTKRTLAIRHHSIKKFLDYLSKEAVEKTTDINKKIVDNYSMRLLLTKSKGRNKPYSAQTRIRLLIDVKNFLHFLCKQDIILSNPAENIELPKLPRRISRDIPSLEEIDRLIASIDKTSPEGIRDTAIIETLYGTGIRANEIVKLEVNDIDFEKRFIAIRQGKFGKDRTVPINKTALDWIKEYLSVRKETGTSVLFLSSAGSQLKIGHIRKIVSLYAKKAGIKKHLIPHSFRYACATHMLRNGADIRYIQELLGHEYLSTTQGYTKVIKNDLKRMIRKFHPREAEYEE
jgi:integrase/recombinase XerD